MTLSNDVLMYGFLNGKEAGNASRMRIEVIDGYRCIIGYGWAVYAADMGDEIALFGDGYASDDTNVGWAGYSGPTTGHLQIIKSALEERDAPFSVVDYRLEERDVSTTDLPKLVEENEVEKREHTGYLYRKP